MVRERDLNASNGLAVLIVLILGTLGAAGGAIYGATHGQTLGVAVWLIILVVLIAYAALQALVLETALSMYPELYGEKGFRRAGIVEQFLVT